MVRMFKENVPTKIKRDIQRFFNKGYGHYEMWLYYSQFMNKPAIMPTFGPPKGLEGYKV